MSRPVWYARGRAKITLERDLYDFLLNHSQEKNVYATHLLDDIVEAWKIKVDK